VVADVARSATWYRDVLGATEHRRYEGACVLRLFGAWMLLVEGGGPTPDKPTVTFAPPPDPDVASAETIFRVPDCRGAYADLASRGATFLTPPVDRGAETRAFFRDPDGHLFEISEYRG